MNRSLKNKIRSLTQYLNDLLRPTFRTIYWRPAACYAFEPVKR